MINGERRMRQNDAIKMKSPEHEIKTSQCYLIHILNETDLLLKKCLSGANLRILHKGIVIWDHVTYTVEIRNRRNHSQIVQIVCPAVVTSIRWRKPAIWNWLQVEESLEHFFLDIERHFVSYVLFFQMTGICSVYVRLQTYSVYVRIFGHAYVVLTLF